MRIIITPTNILAASRENTLKWNVDKTFAWGFDVTEDLKGLPLNLQNVTFFVPTVLDSTNPLSYDGVDLALRILLKFLYETSRGVNIVLLGIESREQFLMNYDYPNILKVPGVYYCLFNQKNVADYPVLDTKNLSQKIYLQPLENLGIKMPSSFNSTHSMTNEWCLYKWSTFMNFQALADSGNLNYLYFDYLKVIEKLNNVKNREIGNNPLVGKRLESLKKKDAKILLVDDNCRWHVFFREFFRGSGISFEAIGENFNKLGIKEVTHTIEEKVELFGPDVILLDFRLVEDMDADSEFDEISGVEILKKLKGQFDAPGASYGRQILMFTATSRIENILRLKQLCADGFILKEKPDQYASKENTKDLILGMICDIDSAIRRSHFLIPMNNKLEDLEKLTSLCVSDEHRRLKESITESVKSVRVITQNNELNDGILKLVYLNLFSILENSKEGSEDIYPYINSKASILGLGSDPDTYALFETLCQLRNALAHNGKIEKGKLKRQEMTSELLKEWILKLLCYIESYLSLLIAI